MSAETERLQALFAEFNAQGSTLVLHEDGSDPVNLFVQDSYTVTRVDGNVFWLLHKALGYNNAPQYSHTLKVVSWSQPDSFELDLVDDELRRFHVELIFPELEPGLGAAWARWQAYRKRNRAMFRVIDAQILDLHTRIAKEWS